MTRDEYFNALESSKNELKHHGVKGQKWGIENGPPYPLDGDRKAAIKEQRKASMKTHDDAAKDLYNKTKEATKLGEISTNSSEYKNAVKTQMATTASKFLINESDRARYFRNINSGKAAMPSAIGAYITSNLKDAGVIYAASVGAGVVGGLLAGPVGAMSAVTLGELAASAGILTKRTKAAIDQNRKY